MASPPATSLILCLLLAHAGAAEVTCWGNNYWGQGIVPEGLGSVVAFATAYDHNCALKEVTGAMVCWGRNDYGQASVPGSLVPVAAMTLGHYHSCVLLKTQELACWGLNSHGQLNAPSGRFVAVTCGEYRCCAIEEGSAAARCWGGYTQAVVPADMGRVRQLVTGGDHACALEETGGMRCWGYNHRGQCNVPTGLGPLRSIVAANCYTCAISEAGAITCWGGQDCGLATIPSDLGNVMAASAGEWHVCALDSWRALRCWGRNDNGRLVVPSLPGRLLAVMAGGVHTCALTLPTMETTTWTTATSTATGTSTSSSTSSRSLSTSSSSSSSSTSASSSSTTSSQSSSSSTSSSTSSSSSMSSTSSSSTWSSTSSSSSSSTSSSSSSTSTRTSTSSTRTWTRTATATVTSSTVTNHPSPRTWTRTATAALTSTTVMRTSGRSSSSFSSQTVTSLRGTTSPSKTWSARTTQTSVTRTASSTRVSSSPMAGPSTTSTAGNSTGIVDLGHSTGVPSSGERAQATPDSASAETLSTSERPQAPQLPADAPEQRPDTWLIVILSSMAAPVAVAGSLALLWYCKRKRHVEQDCDEFNFFGKSGKGKVVVVSCPGGPDEGIGMFQGEIYANIKKTQDLAVSVVYIKDAHIAEFWDAWRQGLLKFAQGKKFVVTITKSDGSIGRVQKEEVAYLDRCKGQKGMADFRNAKMVAMNYKEFFCWGRLGYKQEALGKVLSKDFQTEHCKRLPSLDDVQERFRVLASGRVVAHGPRLGPEGCSDGELETGGGHGGGPLHTKKELSNNGPESFNAAELKTGQGQRGRQEEEELRPAQKETTLRASSGFAQPIVPEPARPALPSLRSWDL